MRSSMAVALLLICVSRGANSAAPVEGPVDGDERSAIAGQSNFELQNVLVEVGHRTKKQFLIGAGVPENVAVGSVELRRITYPLLLTILRNNHLAAVDEGGVVSVIPEANIRHQATRVVSPDDIGIPDDEWVSVFVQLQFATGAQLVPILRPLVPQAGHLAASPEQNSLLLFDRFGNTKRMVDLIRALDKPARTSPQGKP